MLGKYPQEIKLVYKNFPLVFHNFAKKAAIAALAADEQGKFWDFHQKLFENHRSLDDAKIEEIAKETGLEIEAFNRDLKSSALQRLVERDMRDGQRAGVPVIPTVFVNGRLLKDQSRQGLEKMIEAELKKRK